MTKTELLKPNLLACVERMKKLIELDAPAVIVGHEAWNILATTLATYGSAAGSGMVESIKDQNLHGRGVCSYEDCVNYVERPGVNVCEICLKEMGIKDGEFIIDEPIIVEKPRLCVKLKPPPEGF
jgi:hypothetical protein